MTVQHNLETSNWLTFPFEVDGINYVSKIKPNSGMAKRVAGVPANVFLSLNADCVRELIGKATREEAISKIGSINLGASEAVIEIV
jgi:hypothetical protein